MDRLSATNCLNKNSNNPRINGNPAPKPLRLYWLQQHDPALIPYAALRFSPKFMLATEAKVSGNAIYNPSPRELLHQD